MAEPDTSSMPHLNGGEEKHDWEEKDILHHYYSYWDMPAEIQKYWRQRYDLFSLYDEEIRLTDSAWFGVTPEAIAHKITEHLDIATPEGVETVIDCFAGAGGNTIALAQSGRFTTVYAIERDAATLVCAEHNARVYGVHERIVFVHGDCFEVLETQLKDVAKTAVLFASPPWGGPGYRDAEVFDLNGMMPYSLEDLVGGFGRLSRRVVLYLPRSSDLNQIARAWEGMKGKGKVRVTHYCLHGASKAMCVFFGDFNFDST